MIRRIASLLTGLVILASLEGVVLAGDKRPKKAVRGFQLEKIRVSRKTTYLLGPLRKDGTVDFAAALNARASKGITPGNNAAVLIAQVVSRDELSPEVQKLLYAKLGIPKTAKPGQRLVSHWELAKKIAGKNHETYGRRLLKQQEAGRKRLWSKKEMPELATWLKQNRAPLKVVRTAVRRPRWYSPILLPGKEPIDQALMFSLLPLVQGTRDFGRALAASATLAVREGRNDEALNDVRDCRRLARHVASGHSLIEWLVGTAIERFANEATFAILQSGKLTTKQLARLAKDLDGSGPLQSCAEKINNYERLALIDAVTHIRRDGYVALKIFSDLSAVGDWHAKLGWNVVAFFVDWNHVLKMVNAHFDQLHAAATAKPYAKRNAALKKLRSQRSRRLSSIPTDADELCWRFFNWGRFDWMILSRSMGNTIIFILSSGIPAAMYSEVELHSRHGLVRAAVSLEQHRKLRGRFPNKLADLTASLRKTIPTDLFSEKPFHYKRTKSGYLLYSVGPNMKDEKGKSPDPNADSFSSDDPDDIALRVQSPK